MVEKWEEYYTKLLGTAPPALKAEEAQKEERVEIPREFEWTTEALRLLETVRDVYGDDVADKIKEAAEGEAAMAAHAAVLDADVRAVIDEAELATPGAAPPKSELTSAKAFELVRQRIHPLTGEKYKNMWSLLANLKHEHPEVFGLYEMERATRAAEAHAKARQTVKDFWAKEGANLRLIYEGLKIPPVMAPLILKTIYAVGQEPDVIDWSSIGEPDWRKRYDLDEYVGVVFESVKTMYGINLGAPSKMAEAEAQAAQYDEDTAKNLLRIVLREYQNGESEQWLKDHKNLLVKLARDQEERDAQYFLMHYMDMPIEEVLAKPPPPPRPPAKLSPEQAIRLKEALDAMTMDEIESAIKKGVLFGLRLTAATGKIVADYFYERKKHEAGAVPPPAVPAAPLPPIPVPAPAPPAAPSKDYARIRERLKGRITLKDLVALGNQLRLGVFDMTPREEAELGFAIATLRGEIEAVTPPPRFLVAGAPPTPPREPGIPPEVLEAMGAAQRLGIYNIAKSYWERGAIPGQEVMNRGLVEMFYEDQGELIKKVGPGVDMRVLAHDVGQTIYAIQKVKLGKTVTFPGTIERVAQKVFFGAPGMLEYGFDAMISQAKPRVVQLIEEEGLDYNEPQLFEALLEVAPRTLS